VVAALLAIASLLGVLAFYRYSQSERALVAELTAMAKRAASLDVDGCVSETLAWNKRCEAMKTLCDASVPRMMETCLRGADRSSRCRALGDRVMATQYGVAECKARGRTRRDKPCALSYRAIASHCDRILLPHPPEKRAEARGAPSR
jgi:hypothetical protein